LGFDFKAVLTEHTDTPKHPISLLYHEGTFDVFYNRCSMSFKLDDITKIEHFRRNGGDTIEIEFGKGISTKTVIIYFVGKIAEIPGDYHVDSEI
jgi:hypothetical protein